MYTDWTCQGQGLDLQVMSHVTIGGLFNSVALFSCC